jgi:hypothetical protein
MMAEPLIDSFIIAYEVSQSTGQAHLMGVQVPVLGVPGWKRALKPSRAAVKIQVWLTGSRRAYCEPDPHGIGSRRKGINRK